MPRLTVDQWVLELLRASSLSTRYGTNIHIYEVPTGTQRPYALIQLVSGVRSPKTQVLRDAGSTRFQIDVFVDDRYQGRSDIEEIIKVCMVHSLLDQGLRIEHCEVSGPRALPAEECYRFSCDLRVTWTQEE